MLLSRQLLLKFQELCQESRPNLFPHMCFVCTPLKNIYGEKGSSNTAVAWFSDGNTRTEISLFAFDSTGLKPTNRGDWMTEKWGTRRGFIKLHVGVDTRTKKIYAVVITDDKCGDSPQFEELVEQAFANAEKSPNVGTSADAGIAAGGAYDTKNIRSYCNEHGINPLIPVRIDFAGNANGCMPRKEAGFRQLGGFDHIDKKTEHGFADLTRGQKRSSRRHGRKSQDTTTGGQSRSPSPHSNGSSVSA